MGEVQAILWDMDGVLVDTGDLHFEVWQEIFRERNYAFSRDDFERTFGVTNQAILAKILPNLSEPERNQLDRLKEARFRRKLPGQVELMPGVLTWLQQFKTWGCLQAVASSGELANIEAILSETKIEKYFDTLSSGYGFPSKPDPAVFLNAARQLGVPAGACLVIEDSPAGIRGAVRAKMKCLAVTTTRSEEELQEATYILPDLNALTPELARCWLFNL